MRFFFSAISYLLFPPTNGFSCPVYGEKKPKSKVSLKGTAKDSDENSTDNENWVDGRGRSAVMSELTPECLNI